MIVPEPGKAYESICSPLPHPFSRGSIVSQPAPRDHSETDRAFHDLQHIKSADPTEHPEIDPRVFDRAIGGNNSTLPSKFKALLTLNIRVTRSRHDGGDI